MTDTETVITALDARIERLQTTDRDLKRDRSRVEKEIKANRDQLWAAVALRKELAAANGQHPIV